MVVRSFGRQHHRSDGGEDVDRAKAKGEELGTGLS